MPLSDELVERAARMNVPAIEDVLSYYRPAVHRLAVALTGRQRSGETVARDVLLKSLKFAGTWDVAAKVERWFYHHTIQTARPYADRPPDAREDVLLPAVARADPQLLAFVRAIRSLAPQQREAYLLTVAEQLPPRPTATAMDCSLEASANHLAIAKRTLTSIVGERYAELELMVATTYANLTPRGDETLPLVRSTLRRHVWPRRINLFLQGMLLLAVLGGLTWAVWTIYPMLDW